MKVLLRNFALAALPLLFGLGAGYGLAIWTRGQSCTALVGPLFAAKCHGRMLEYQLVFQTLGTAAGTLVAALLGTWLELRRRRVVQPSPTKGSEP